MLAELWSLATPLAGQCEADPAPSGTANPQTADGRTFTFERVAGVIPEATADSVFAGFYFPATRPAGSR